MLESLLMPSRQRFSYFSKKGLKKVLSGAPSRYLSRYHHKYRVPVVLSSSGSLSIFIIEAAVPCHNGWIFVTCHHTALPMSVESLTGSCSLGKAETFLPACVQVLVEASSNGGHGGYIVRAGRIVRCVDPHCPAAALAPATPGWSALCKDVGDVEYCPTLTFATLADLRRAVLADYSAAASFATPVAALSGAAPPGSPCLVRRPVIGVGGGWGLFAAAALPASFLVGEYAGLWVVDGEDGSAAAAAVAAAGGASSEGEAAAAAERDGYRACYPAIDSRTGGQVGVSALRLGNHMRLVNHAPSPPDASSGLSENGSGRRAYANVRFAVLTLDGRGPEDGPEDGKGPEGGAAAAGVSDLPRIGLVTLRAVAEGEQILADYGSEYWRRAGVAACDLL